MKSHYPRIFRKSVEKIWVSLKYDKNNEHFTRTLHICQYRAHFVLESETLHIKLEEQIKTYFIFNITPENHAVYERDDVEIYGTAKKKSQMAM